MDAADPAAQGWALRGHSLPQPKLHPRDVMTLTDEQRAVTSMIRHGRPFDEIEDYINALPLPSAHLGALWLLAWTEATDPQTRSRVVADTISALSETARGSP